jgi:hypothetical protein
MQDEICRLRGIIDNQNRALMHWRRLSDQDTGKIARLERELNGLRSSMRDIHALAARQLAEPPDGTETLVRIATLAEEALPGEFNYEDGSRG